MYSALGNNDSGCADYSETPADTFVKSASSTLAAAADLTPASFSPEGDYSVQLPSPIQHTRFIVLQDIFEARQFTPCGASGSSDRSPEKAQLDWLRKELTAAHARGEQVWVMAHMPPGLTCTPPFDATFSNPQPFARPTLDPFSPTPV